MVNSLKKTLLYRLFLRLRTRRLSDDRLRTQLMKRGHNLDKCNIENRPGGVFLYEVKLLLDEMCRRALDADDTTRWAWDVVYESCFGPAHPRTRDVPTVPLAADDVLDALKRRRSVRQWTDDAVTPAEVEPAIEAAKWAPSSCNRQPWLFLILTKREDIEFMGRFTHQEFFKKAPMIIVALVDTAVYGADEAHFAYLDLGAAIQNLLVALHAGGLGACWLGVKFAGSYPEVVKAFRGRFDIKDTMIPASFVAVGRPAGTPRAPERKPTAAIRKVVA